MKEKEFYNLKFNGAQIKEGLLWQPIISFDNEWLEENEIIHEGVVDNKKIKQATKSAMTYQVQILKTCKSCIYIQKILINLIQT